MKQYLTFLVVLLAFAAYESGFAQVSGGTGRLGVQLSTYGRVRMNTPAWDGGLRHADRMSFIAAWDSLHVFDYQENADTNLAPARIVGGVADTILTVLTDSEYPPPQPPDIHVRVTVYMWRNDDFVIVKYTTRNVSATTYQLYLAAAMVPKPSNVYGGETVSWDATKKVAYFFRASQNAYTGIKVLGGDPYSFHVLDWNVYSPDPNSDAAHDTTRWKMTARPGFDTGLTTAGVDGSMYHVTAGRRTIPAGDSASVYYALMYSASLTGLQTAADSAVSRYNRNLTSVQQTSSEIPDRFTLAQNYPNPFNPSTTIKFQIPNTRPGFVSLKVCDVLGNEVATLVHEPLAPGSYSIPFVADRLSSGVYFYRLTSGTRNESKRMLLLK